VQLSGASANFHMRAPGHSFQMSMYGSCGAFAVGSSGLLQMDDELLGTNQWSGITLDSADGVTAKFSVTAGLNNAASTAATGSIATGDLFRLDWKTVYNGSSITNTLAIYYRGNIEGTTPDETITATHSVTNYAPWIRIGSATGFITNIDTIRIYDVAATILPFNPATLLSGDGTLSASASPAVAVSPGLTGAGSLAVTPVAGVAGTPALSGDGVLAASTVPSPTAAPALSGSGVLAVPTRTPGPVVAPALGGAGTLSVAATPAVSSSPALSGGGTLAVTARTPAVATTPALGGTGTLAVTARTPAVTTAPALGGTGTLNVSTGSAGSSSPALSGAGALTVARTPAFATTPSLAGTGTLTVTALLATSSPATFSGDGVLAALAQMAISTSLAFLGSGTLTAERVSTGILAAVLEAQPPDDDPGAVASAQALGPDAWLNRRHVRHSVDAWLGPVITRADAVLNLAVTAGVPGDSDWTAPFYVAGRPGYLFDTPSTPGRYHLWCRDGITGDPSPFATITVT
jgi:hypothetical protein